MIPVINQDLLPPRLHKTRVDENLVSLEFLGVFSGGGRLRVRSLVVFGVYGFLQLAGAFFVAGRGTTVEPFELLFGAFVMLEDEVVFDAEGVVPFNRMLNSIIHFCVGVILLIEIEFSLFFQ